MARSLVGASIGANFLKTTRRMLDRQVQSPDARARVAKHLKLRLEEMAEGGEVPTYRQWVNGTETKDFSTVTFRDSVIEIQFQLLDGVIRAMLDYAKTISPIRSGAFREGWFVAVNGVPWTDFSKQIPHNSTVIMTNFAPYARRLEEQGRLGRSGRLSSYARPELVVTARVQQWAQKQFPGAQIDRLFVTIPGGGVTRGWQVPYVLKRGPHRGEQITYPALRLTER